MNTLQITRCDNGFGLEWWEETDEDASNHVTVIEDDENDKMKSGEEILWFVMNHFDLGGSKFDKKRLTINRVRGDHYESPSKTIVSGMTMLQPPRVCIDGFTKLYPEKSPMKKPNKLKEE
jgi:hypothetical protein